VIRLLVVAAALLADYALSVPDLRLMAVPWLLLVAGVGVACARLTLAVPEPPPAEPSPIDDYLIGMRP
jgi:hypothetical protein